MQTQGRQRHMHVFLLFSLGFLYVGVGSAKEMWVDCSTYNKQAFSFLSFNNEKKFIILARLTQKR